MKEQMKPLFSFILLIACGFLSAQKITQSNSKHVVWRTYYEPSKEKLDEGFIVFEAVVDSGYQIYAMNQMPGLPVGVDISIKSSRDFTVKGELIAPKPVITFSHTYDKPIAVYKGKVEFRQKIRLKTKEEFKLSASVEDEEISKTDEMAFFKEEMELSIRPPKGIRLRFF